MSSQTKEEQRAVTNTICQCMQGEWTREKTPYRLKAALEKTKQSESSSTEKIFLEEGFAVWLAYYLAISGDGHYEGPPSRARAFANFHGLSVEERRAAAKTASETSPHPSFLDAVRKMLNKRDIRCKWLIGSAIFLFLTVQPMPLWPISTHQKVLLLRPAILTLQQPLLLSRALLNRQQAYTLFRPPSTLQRECRVRPISTQTCSM